MNKYTERAVRPSGIWVPNSKNTDKSYASMLDNISVYITSSDIPSKRKVKFSEKILLEKLRKFNGIDLIQVLSKLNLAFGDQHHKFKLIERKLVKDLFSGKTAIEIIKLIDSNRKLFIRPQLLSLMKFLILNFNYKGIKNVIDNLEELGEIFLMINDILELDLRTISDKEKEFEKIVASAIRTNTFFKREQFRYLIARYNLLFFDYPSKLSDKSFSIPEIYEELVGVNIKLFMHILISIYSFYQSKIKHVNEFAEWPQKYLLDRNYYRNTPEDIKSEVRNIFNLISEDISGFKKMIEETGYDIENKFFGFINFKKKPLLRLNNNSYLLIDFTYLQDKLTSGIYWDIFNNIDDDNEKNNFASYWGKLFEIYTFDILKRCFGGSKRLFLEDEKRGQFIDAIIYYPETLIFLEITSKKIKPRTLMSGNYEENRLELSDLFFGGVKSKKGELIQLCREIERFKNGEINLNGIEPSLIKKYYPVIIFEDSPTNLPILDYKKIFNKEINDNKISDYMDRLQFIDIEELEILEPLINSGKSLKDLLDSKIYNYPSISFKNFLYNAGIKELDNQFLMKEFKNFWDESIKTLFPKK